jgi:hypothetical protein
MLTNGSRRAAAKSASMAMSTAMAGSSQIESGKNPVVTDRTAIQMTARETTASRPAATRSFEVSFGFGMNQTPEGT